MYDNTQTVSWDVGSNINNANNSARNVFSDLASASSSSIVDTMGKYNVLGINVNAIDDMRFAIRVYVENIETHLNSVRQEAMDTQAFKGQYANAIVEYVNAACDVVRSLTSQLLAFSDKLVEIKEIYQERDVSLTQSLNTVASNVQTGVSNYNETR